MNPVDSNNPLLDTIYFLIERDKKMENEEYENLLYWGTSGPHLRKNTKEIDKEPRKFWMVTGDGNTPKVRQTSYAKARAEAERLADKHPGVDFYVLEATDCLTKRQVQHTKL